MKIKKIGAILAGAVMIGSAVAASGAWDPSEHEDFFINPDTGQPNAVIVVGANAAASDVTGAAWIAAEMGNMARRTVYTEKVGEYIFDENSEGWPNGSLVVPTEVVDGIPFGILDTLYYKDLDENETFSWGDVAEGLWINNEAWCDWPDIWIEGIEDSPIGYGALFQRYEPFVFLGKTYEPFDWDDESITFASIKNFPTHAIEMGTYTYNGYKVNFKDIDLHGDFVLIEITDLEGEKKEYILGSRDTVTLKDDEGNKLFKLWTKGIWLGQETTHAYIKVRTWSSYQTVDLPIYCLDDGVNYWNVDIVDEDPSNDSAALVMWFTGFVGYGNSMPPIERKYSIPIFDLTKVETLEFVDGSYITIDFDSEVCTEEPEDGFHLPCSTPYPPPTPVYWELQDVTFRQKTGVYEKEQIPVEISPMEWILNDDEVTIAHKLNYNLILVGGPGLVLQPNGESLPANTLTREIVENNLSAVDWYTATGVYEYIEDVYSDKDVIIVAGADRVATKNAVIALLTDLNA